MLRLKAAVALPLLLGVAALVYWLFIDGMVRDQLIAQSISYAGKGGNAEVERVSFSIFGPQLKVEKLRAWQNLEGGKEHEVIWVKEAVFDVEFWPLLERRVVVNQLTATQVRWRSPISDEPEPEVTDTPPTDTSNGTLNDYLKKAQEVLNSEELRQALQWIDKLEHYTQENQAEEPSPQPPGNEPAPPGNQPAPTTAPAGNEAAVVVEEEKELGPAERAPYVTEALSKVGAQPSFVLRKAGLDELAITWGSPKKERFARKVTDLLLSAEEVSSDPVAYGKPMQFKAEGNLDGEASRRVTLGLAINFDAQSLIKVEQVNGIAGIKTLSLKGLVDTDLFGETLTDVGISISHFSGLHGEFPRRTRLMLQGGILPKGFDKPGKASFSLWFGGYAGGKTWTAFMPSGIGVQVENFPLQGLLKLAGGSGLPIEDGPASISFGTCDAAGNFGTPDAAMTWHDGFKVKLRLSVQGLRFKETGDAVGGAPGALVFKGLNRVLAGMGGLDVIVGFEGGKDRIALGLERPGLRAFFDAIVNALEVSAGDLEGFVELPFAVDGDARIGLASVNADSSKRDPKLNLSGETRHDLNDLRVSFNLKGVNLKPKAGQSTILGLPAEDFCRAFNAFLGQEGGLALRTRIFDAKGAFSPALESPGIRGLVDGIAGALSFTGTQINSQFNLPMTIAPEAVIKCASVDADGRVRGLSSPGADSDSLKGLRLVLKTEKLQVTPKPGESTIWGLPAADFCAAFNTFAGTEEGKGLAFTFGLFDDKAVFAPSLISPGARGLVDALAGVMSYSGAQINQQFNLPVSLPADTRFKLSSVDDKGVARTLASPGADSMSLAGLRLRLHGANFKVSPKPGQKDVLGLPPQEFCNAFNTFLESQGSAGLALDFGILDEKGTFSPTLKNPGVRGLMDGVIGSLKYSGKQLNSLFNLPFELVDVASAEFQSVDAAGKPRTAASAGADGSDLKDFRVFLLLKNGFAAKKKGVDTVLGIPADYFTFAWNKLNAGLQPTGLPLTLRLFDAKGVFAPAIEKPDDKQMVAMLGQSVGIADFAKNFAQTAGKFGEFDDFQKRGIDAAKDMQSGKIKLPGTGEKKPDEKPEEKPKLPEVPKIKLPWGK